MKYETHCDDSGVGMFKMASGVSFVKQFLDSPAEGAKHNDAGCSQRQLYSCARLQLNIVCVLDRFSHSDSSYKLESVVGNIHFI